MDALCAEIKQNKFFSLLNSLQTGYVFADDVELEVDDRAHADVLEVGVLKGVGDDGHLEGVACGVTDGERHAVDGDGALVDGEIAVASLVGIEVVGEGEIGGAVGVGHGGAAGCLVDVALYDVAVKTAVHQHGALYVDLVADL